MDGDSAAQGCVVFDPYVSAEHDIICGDDSVFDNAIVRDVACGHEVAIVTDRSDPLVFFSASIDGHALTKDVAVSDDNLGWRTLVGKILWLSTDNATGEEAVVAADHRVPCDGDSIFKPRSPTDFHVGTDDTMMSDANIFVEFGSRIYHGGVSDDRWHIQTSLSIVLALGLLVGSRISGDHADGWH